MVRRQPIRAARARALAIAALAAILVLPAGGRAEDVPAAVPVYTVGFSFVPAVVTVPAGGTVEWRNDLPGPGIEHTIATASSLENSRAGIYNDRLNNDADPDTFNVDFPGGATFSHRFDHPGTFFYFCFPHHGLGMIGRVDVVAAP
jgi:plastocyanin